MRKSILLFISAIFVLSISAYGQDNRYLELVESIPVETMLDNPDIRNTQEVWLEMINSAKSTLDIEQFYISNEKNEPLDTIINAIVAAGDRGVKVRLIVDSKMYKTYPETVDMLGQQKNITKHIIDFGKLAGGIQHAKYFIVDDEEIFLGSQNFDWRALKHIHELGLLLKGTNAIYMYKGIFKADWEYSESDTTTKWVCSGFTINKYYPMSDIKYGKEIILRPTISPNDYSHVNGYRDLQTIKSMIENSKSEVLLQFLTYNSNSRDGYWSELDSALINVAARGVQVKLIVSDWSIGKNQIDCLKHLSSIPNIEVMYSSIPEYSGGYIPFARVEHCKYIVADTVCWIGSANAEKSYFYNTRNAGMAVESGIFALEVHDIFMKDWAGPYTHYIYPDGDYIAREHGER